MSASEQVDIMFRSDAGAAVAAMNAIAQGMGQIAQAGQKAQSGAQSLFDFTGGSILKMTMQIAGIGTALQAVHSVGRLIMAEYENFLAKNRAAAGVQLDFGDEMRKVGQMLGGDVGKMAQFRRGVVGLTQQTGVPSAQIAAGFAETLGAGMSTTPEAVFAAVSQAARYRPGQKTGSSELHSIARGIIGIQSSFPGTSTEQAMAGIQSFMAADPTTNVEKFTQHMLPGVLMAATEGDTFQDLASMFAGVGQRAHDWWGRTTRNNMINFLKQIKIKTARDMPGQATYQDRFGFLFGTPKGEQIRREMLGPLWQGGDRAQGFLEGADPMAQQIVRGLIGEDIDLKTEAKYLVPFVEFLSGGNNQTNRQIAAARAKIFDLKDPRGLAQFRGVEAAIQADPSQLVPQTSRAVSGISEGMRLTDTIAGVTGAYRDQLPGLLQAAGVSSTVQSIAMGVFDARTSTARTSEDVRAAAIAAIGEGRSVPRARPASARFDTAAMRQPIPLTEQQEITNQKLDELIQVLKNGQTLKIESGGEHVRGTTAAERAGQ